MKSTRAWFVGLFPLLAILTIVGMDIRRVAVQTLDWRDLCIDGRGYIETRDDNGANPVWLRCIRLGVDQTGQLCANVDGEMRPIEPIVNIPSDWTEIDIDENGTVRIPDSNSTGVTIGMLNLTVFAGEDSLGSTSVSGSIDRLGPPMVVEPGEQGAGKLLQGMAFQYCLPFSSKTIVALVWMVIWIAGLFVYVRSERRFSA